MSTLERGFKSWCERQAAALRAELRLRSDQPIDVFALTRHLGVATVAPDEIDGLGAETLAQVLERDSGGWSAVTLTSPRGSTIIFNSTHSPGRIASNIAHEVAHLLLSHEGSQRILSVGVELVMRAYDAKQEDEANWLGWTILLPRGALVRARAGRKSVADIAREFGVSQQLVEFRLRKTGVDRQVKGRRNRR